MFFCFVGLVRIQPGIFLMVEKLVAFPFKFDLTFFFITIQPIVHPAGPPSSDTHSLLTHIQGNI